MRRCNTSGPFRGQHGRFLLTQPGSHRCLHRTGRGLPLLAREQSLVVAVLEAIAQRLPFQVPGIDSDDDMVFINGTVTK